ncbi:MAG: hypothetical protein IIV16_03340, partial [Alistipes sp.]|nr:hypothetical protein [Alistipes sp.]
MAESVKETVLSIRVDSAQAIQQLADYSALIEQCRKREQELKQSIKEGNDTTGEQAKELLAVVEARKQYTRQTQIASKEVQNNITQRKAEEGSLKSLRAELSNLTKKYDEMGRARRDSQEGKDLQEQINNITKELKGAEEGTQRFYRNVGNYAGSLGGLFEKLQSDAKAAIPGIEALGLKSQSSFGWISVVAGALVGLIGFFKKAVTSSEELSMRSSEMFAFLKTGAVQLQNLLQSIGNTLLNWAQFVFDLVEKGQRLWAKLTGREAEYNQQLSERKKLANELTKQQKEENAITLEQRKINEKNADSELKIAKLRAQAADKVTYSARQRLQFIKEASDEERRISERNYNLAKREYELQKQKSALAGNSAEENEALSQAYTKMIQAKTAYFNKDRELRGQMAETTKQMVAEEMALLNARKKANEELLKDFGQFMEITADEMGADIDQINKDYLLGYKNRIAEAKLLGQNTLALEVEAKKAELDALHQLEEESDAEFKARQLAAQQAYVDAKKALADYEVQIEVGKWNAIGSAMNALSGLLGEFSEESKAAAVASKALALGEIAIKTGVALAGGIAQAQSVPFPANIAAIAITVATILANIATAIKTVKGAKFSTGGYVSGEGTGTSDSIPAMLSNGESVNNA